MAPGAKTQARRPFRFFTRRPFLVIHAFLLLLVSLLLVGAPKKCHFGAPPLLRHCAIIEQCKILLSFFFNICIKRLFKLKFHPPFRHLVFFLNLDANYYYKYRC